MNFDIYPDEYPTIETIEIQDKLLSLSRQLISNVLIDNQNIRQIGQMNRLNQLHGSSDYDAFTQVFSEDGMVTDKRLGWSSEREKDNISPTVGEGDSAFYVKQSVQGASETTLPVFEKGLEFIPPQMTGRTPTSPTHNQIPADSSFKPIPSFKGRGGYLMGGTTSSEGQDSFGSTKIQKMNFLAERITAIGSRLDQENIEPAVSGEKSGTWVFGGWNGDIKTCYRSITRINYIDDLAIKLARSLSAPRAMATATSTEKCSYIMGGIYNNPSIKDNGYPFSTTVEKLDHLSKIATITGNILPLGLSATPNSKGNKIRSYLMGSLVTSWQPSNLIYRLNFVDETVQLLGTFLAEHKPRHASMGNEKYIYLLGGEKANPSPRWGDAYSSIVKLDMDTETISSLGISLANSRSHAGSLNSNQFGFILGGWGGDAIISGDNRTPSRSVEKMSPLNTGETIQQIGLSLSYPVASFSSISDYGESFYGE